jgi:hypothetical protein
MIEKFKKSSSDRIVGWVKAAVDILNARGVSAKLVIKGQ